MKMSKVAIKTEQVVEFAQEMYKQGSLGKALLYVEAAYSHMEYLAWKDWLVNADYWQDFLRGRRKELIESSLDAIKNDDGLKLWKVKDALYMAKITLEPLAVFEDNRTQFFLSAAKEEIMQEMLKTSKNFRF